MYRRTIASLAVVCVLATKCGSNTTTVETTMEVPQLESGPASRRAALEGAAARHRGMRCT